MTDREPRPWKALSDKDGDLNHALDHVRSKPASAPYAQEFPHRRDFSETRLLLKFLDRLIDADGEKLLYELVWQHLPTSGART